MKLTKDITSCYLNNISEEKRESYQMFLCVLGLVGLPFFLKKTLDTAG